MIRNYSEKQQLFFQHCLLIISVFLLITQPGLYAAAQTTKTPKMPGSSAYMKPVDPIKMPDDYPQDLLNWFKKNMDARSYIVMDMETNRILAQQEGNTPYPIASMSKLAAVYLVYKAIDEGKLTMDTPITIPQEVADNISANPELSNVGLVGGEKYPVKDLLYGVLLASGNDATSALMWNLYGNEELAVNAIKEQLAQWGITNIQFYQSSGAPNQYLPESMWVPGSSSSSENYMSAEDVALMAQHLVTDYPQVLDITSSPQYTFMAGTQYETVLNNPNLLLPGQEYGREHVTGLKSGYTDLAGRNFVATSTESGRKVIAVAMGVFGEGMNSYWEIEILLDALNGYPELYKNNNLPLAKEITPEEEAAQEAKEAEETKKNNNKNNQDSKDTKNLRDNPLTNTMDNLFGIFN